VPEEFAGHSIYVTIFLFWGAILIFILHSHHLYTTSRYLSLLEEGIIVAKSVVYSSILASLFIFLSNINIFSRLIFVECVLILFVVLSLWRFVKRVCLRQLIKNGFLNFNVLIIGASNEAESLIQEIKNYPYLGLRIIGLLDDKKTGIYAGIKIVGTTDKLEFMIKRYFIDEVYVAGDYRQQSVKDIISKCIRLGKTVKLLVDDLGISVDELKFGYLGPIALVTYFEQPAEKINSLIKRLFDVFVSGSMLILLFPLFIVIFLLVKFVSSGPVFYISRRSGRKGIEFNLLKFRSMVSNADSLKEGLKCMSETNGPIFKIKNDPRITRIGRFLRKYSLDELPQLVNVLKGDMSLVGPRPFPVEESEKIEYKHIPRLNIRPGITGLAQVKGRSNLKFSQWMKWDLWYVNNWSLALDIRIILWTIPAVIKGEGAY
jgi:exopolysaccharide biosynthesis polyprenyl glycosylphosphotransferase